MQKDELHIGEFDNNPFMIDGSRFLTGRTAVMGMSGSGKSYLIGVLCEELCKADLPFIIIDPEGEYKSLKEKFDIVWACNDPDADVLLNFQICEKLADVAVNKHLKLIFDTSESSNEFDLVEEFLKHFYEVEDRVRTPMLLILEEADRFAPQGRGERIDELMEISRRGRKRGIGLVIATQRPAMVDKNILSQCGNQFIGRLRTENDLNAVGLFFRSKSDTNTIPDLEDGHFYSMGDISPAVQNVHIRKRETTHGGGTPGRTSQVKEVKELKIFQDRPADLPVTSNGKAPELVSAQVSASTPEKQPVAIENNDIDKTSDLTHKDTSQNIERRDTMEIDHFVWYPIHGKGYQDKPVAISGEFNPGLFTNVFNKEFAPLMMSYSQKDYRGFMFFDKPNIRQVLFTFIYHKVVDEYGRRGVIHHSAIIDRKDLKNGKVSLHDIEDAMNRFDEANPAPKGDIPALEVPAYDTPKYAYQDKLYKYVSKGAVETLATRMLNSPANRTSFRCQGAGTNNRKNIALYLIELLGMRGGIPISFCTERPISNEYYQFFNLAVTERAIAPSANAEDWAVVNWDELNVGMPRVGGKEEVYKLIDEAFE